MTNQPHLWLRAETKPQEARTALTPSACQELLKNGFKITVEKSKQRVFDDEEYSKLGLELVEEGSWRNAPADAYIVALKELPENDNSALKHKHIFFAHCFKHQQGWKELISRFEQGKGTILDLEFLTDDKGRRVAAFGFYAGFAGSAVGIDAWCQQILEPGVPLKGINPYPNEAALLAYLKPRYDAAVKKYGKEPKIMVMGALGRCGSGAVGFAKKLGIKDENIVKWDMAETAKGGPFVEILESEIFVNCIYLTQPIAPFLTKEMLKKDRAITVLVDVSCDITNANNPIPVYDRLTYFKEPTLSVTAGSKPFDVVSIDHLPSMLPRESSEQFCKDLLPSLLELKDRANSKVWIRAEDLYKKKVTEKNE
ncbi:hypothetical protein MP638_005850 [Amoeboaphelidium occidentale]|nr:hypothetical protein MP638_005850 [Amoeboaphelidium occidentale]